MPGMNRPPAQRVRVSWTRTNADGDIVVVLDTPTCPHCGNAERATIEDNGLARDDENYTRLCIRRVDPNQSSFDMFGDGDVDPNGQVACGYQWGQDYEVYDADGVLVGEFKNHG
jgi:hypothetical protein